MEAGRHAFVLLFKHGRVVLHGVSVGGVSHQSHGMAWHGIVETYVPACFLLAGDFGPQVAASRSSPCWFVRVFRG